MLRSNAISSQPGNFPDAPQASRFDDVSLMEQLLGGEDHALAEIYDRYSTLVFAVACHVVQNCHTAEDISQEVFLHLWRNPKSYDSQRGLLGPWLAVVTRRRAIDHIRKLRKESKLDYMALPIEETRKCDAYDWVDLEKVRAILKQIPGERREAFELAYFGGLTHTEIAERTGLALGTVKSRIRRVLENMRVTLANVQQCGNAKDNKPSVPPSRPRTSVFSHQFTPPPP